MDFETINQQVRDMSREQAEQRFGECSHAELLTYYERGAILHHADRVYFENDEAGYQAWVLGTLRIPLDLSKRLVRVYLAILHSGFSADDFKGISMSSVLFMAHILRRPSDRRWKGRVPELMEKARTSSVQEVKDLVYDLRGMEKRSRSEKDDDESLSALARDVRRKEHIDQAAKLMGEIGREFDKRGWVFAYRLADPEIPSGIEGSTPQVRDLWGARCGPALMDFVRSLRTEGDTSDEDDGAEDETIVLTAHVDIGKESESASDGETA